MDSELDATTAEPIFRDGVDTTDSGRSSATVTGQSDISASHRRHHSRHLSSRHVRQNTFQLLSTRVSEEAEEATGSNLKKAWPLPGLPLNEVVFDGPVNASSSHARKCSDITVDSVLEDNFMLEQFLGQRFGQHRQAGGDDSKSALGFGDSNFTAIIRRNYGINDSLSLHDRNTPRRARYPPTLMAPATDACQIRDQDAGVSSEPIPIYSVKATSSVSGDFTAGESMSKADLATLLGLDVLNSSTSSFDFGEDNNFPVAENVHDAYILLGGIKDSISIIDSSKYPFKQDGENCVETSFRSHEDDNRFFDMVNANRNSSTYLELAGIKDSISILDQSKYPLMQDEDNCLETSFRSQEDDSRFIDLVNANRNSSTYLALAGIKDSISILDQSKYPFTQDEDNCLETSFRSQEDDTRFFDVVNANRYSSTYLALGGIKDSISILDHSRYPFVHESKRNLSHSFGSKGDDSQFCSMVHSIDLGNDPMNETSLSYPSCLTNAR